jgi:hypothetical protein
VPPVLRVLVARIAEVVRLRASVDRAVRALDAAALARLPVHNP